MENFKTQKTCQKAKAIVEILNQAKLRTFINKEDLRTWLKERRCPYADYLVPYLSKTGDIIPHPSGNYIDFKDKNPYYYGNFIVVIERFRHQKNKYNKEYNANRKKEKEEIEKVVTDKMKKPVSLWTKFWVKLLFRLEV